MNDTHEAISSFVDDELFSADELAAALSEPAGRELLIDLIALRHLTQTERNGAHALTDRTPTRSALRALLGVAAVLVALVGGYFAGERRSETTVSEAPPATRVVEAPAAWQNVPLEGTR